MTDIKPITDEECDEFFEYFKGHPIINNWKLLRFKARIEADGERIAELEEMHRRNLAECNKHHETGHLCDYRNSLRNCIKDLIPMARQTYDHYVDLERFMPLPEEYQKEVTPIADKYYTILENATKLVAESDPTDDE